MKFTLTRAFVVLGLLASANAAAVPKINFKAVAERRGRALAEDKCAQLSTDLLSHMQGSDCAATGEDSGMELDLENMGSLTTAQLDEICDNKCVEGLSDIVGKLRSNDCMSDEDDHGDHDDHSDHDHKRHLLDDHGGDGTMDFEQGIMLMMGVMLDMACMKAGGEYCLPQMAVLENMEEPEGTPTCDMLWDTGVSPKCLNDLMDITKEMGGDDADNDDDDEMAKFMMDCVEEEVGSGDSSPASALACGAALLSFALVA